MAAKVRPPLPDGAYLVVGLARSGAAIAKLLAGRGETVIGVDSGAPQEAADLGEHGVEVHLTSDGLEHLGRVETIVKSPGVPGDVPVIASARETGKQVVGELELAWRLSAGRVTAITGTNGKTTVTEWIGHAFGEAGRDSVVAGNVGTPLAAVAEDTAAGTEIVCECSSFQLEDSVEFAPDAAVLLNVTPDHIDRHGTLEDYRDAKLRIFANQAADDAAIWDSGDQMLSPDLIGGDGARMPYGKGGIVDADERSLLVEGEPMLGLSELALPGEHNVRNAMAVATACLAAGIERGAIAAGLAGFPGVPHRLEKVTDRDGILYVNDSKATNVAAAAAALSAFDRPIRVILGGSLKGGGFAGLRAPVSERCAGVYLTGEAASVIAGDLDGIGVPIEVAVDFDDAVARASADAREGDVVLLAPACASFDEFLDYEARGERFVDLVGGRR